MMIRTDLQGDKRAPGDRPDDKGLLNIILVEDDDGDAKADEQTEKAEKAPAKKPAAKKPAAKKPAAAKPAAKKE